ncbi:MAG: LysM peptidoglycan-binding domain-containing protein, partial [Stenotrophomonas koreensis]
RAGESLWAIARRHGIPLARLLSSNGLSNSAILKPGMELRIESTQ